MSFVLFELLIRIGKVIVHPFLQEVHDLAINLYLLFLNRSLYDQPCTIDATDLFGDNSRAPQVDAHCNRILAIDHSVLSAEYGLGWCADLAYILINRANHLI